MFGVESMVIQMRIQNALTAHRAEMAQHEAKEQIRMANVYGCAVIPPVNPKYFGHSNEAKPCVVGLFKCAYCGTPRHDRTHNCRNCDGLEVMDV